MMGPRERILDTASRLFYSQGYNRTGINQILEEAKVAKASLYQHFKSKEEVGVAYLQVARTEWFEGMDKWVRKKNTPAEKLKACFDFLEYALSSNEFRGCKFINILSELGDSESALEQEVIAHKTKLRNYIKSFVKTALGSSAQSEVISDSIYLLFEGAIVESKIYKNSWPVKSARKMASFLLEQH